MKVSELIELLKKYDQDSEVIMSCDEEGNGFSPLSDISNQIYVPDSTYSGDIYQTELDDDIEEEEDIYDGDDGVKAIVLWPTN